MPYSARWSWRRRTNEHSSHFVLPGAERHPVRPGHRRVRLQTQHHHHLHGHRTDAQRREPGFRGLCARAQSARWPGLRLFRDRGRRRRICGGPRHHHHPVSKSPNSEHRTHQPAQILMFILDHLWIIIALPLLGAAINGLLGKNFSKPIVNSVGIGSIALPFLSFAELIREFAQLPAEQTPWVKTYFTWITAGQFRVDFSLQVDQLTIIMLGVVTFVSLLVHIYSTGYMAHEEGYYRFFRYLNLFVFFMLTLVLAANVVLMFVGWEGVGLCSYLLVGFWFLKQSAISAGKKAFITTRIGDFGFTIGILLLFWTFKSVDFGAIFKQLVSAQSDAAISTSVLTTICLLLFVGAVGKSAQLPLYVWLPDAMEGPTPVSALIHAATMVTAGVYMVARMNPVFCRAPVALAAIATVGAVTAIYAASMGLVQHDIKRVLAYSTVSQLGYMFLALGVGAFTAGIFHLMTHAFFKALLF